MCFSYVYVIIYIFRQQSKTTANKQSIELDDNQYETVEYNADQYYYSDVDNNDGYERVDYHYYTPNDEKNKKSTHEYTTIE